MNKTAIIRFLRNNISNHGSLYGHPLDCALCDVAMARKGTSCGSSCAWCPLWDHMPRPEWPTYICGCDQIKYKGKNLHVLNSRLAGNRPALRALLKGLDNYFG